MGFKEIIMNGINGFGRITQQVYRIAKDIRKCVCCNGHPSNNVRNNSTNRDYSLIPFDSLMHNPLVATQPARRLTNQDQGLALRDTLDNNNQDLKKHLDNWVSEAPDERAVRERVKDKIQIINSQLVVEGNLDLNNTNISSLPQGLHVGGGLDLYNCTSLIKLPQGLHVGGDLYLAGSTSLTTLPQGLTVGGDLYLNDCTSLTSLPDWVFELRQSVDAQNTGIPARLLAEYNDRQNATGYNGPRINFSINDYRPISDVSASQLPNLVEVITQTDANHPFWQFAATQTDHGSLFNSFALFLTRLLNELPAGNKRQIDLAQLTHKLTPLFRKMEEEYDANSQDISQCDFINNHILSAAETAIGTCIDKVKVGYLFMQLFVKDNFLQDLTTMKTIIKTVDDIASARVVFNASTNQFIHVAKTILDGDFDDTLKLQAKFLLNLTDDSSIKLTDDDRARLNDIGSFSMDKNELTQLLYSAIFAQNPQIRAMRIGDDVEDILNLAYTLLSDDFHKIDMRFAGCCTLKNSSEPGGPQYETAAKTYIQHALHYQQQ